MRHAPLASAALAALVALAAAAHGAAYESVTTFTGGYVTPPAVTTTAIGAGQDDRTVSVALPFRFVFFGRPYDTVSVSENGWLAFGTTTSTQAEPAILSSAAPNAVVAALWMDLVTRADGSVKTFTLGAAPERTFVVAWEHVDTFTGASDDDMSFEVLLHEGSGVVEIAYAAGGTWDGISYAAGIEDSAGTLAYGAPNLSNANTARPTSDWRFTPTAVAVTGTVLRDRPVASATGLGPGVATDLPVAGADVELVREDTGETIASGTTDAAGAFSLVALGVDAPATLAADLVASGGGARVTDAFAKVYRRRIASGIAADGTPAVGTVRLTSAVDAVDPAFRRALNVQQAARRALDWANAAAAAAAQSVAPATAAETFPELELRWVPGAGVSGGTTYTPAAQTAGARVTVNDATANPDPWDDDVIVRGVGVHVFATASALPSAFLHSWAVAQPTEGQALADGFSWWFAAAVAERPSLVDTLSSTAATVYDLEAPSPAASGPAVAGAIAASMWDLCDAANEAADEVAGAMPASALDAFAVVDRKLDALPAGTTQFTVRSFFDAWTATRAAGVQAAAARVFIRLGTLPDDAEPNDRAGEETPFPTATQRLADRVLNPYNEDRFAFTLGGAGDEPLSVAFVQTDQVEVAVEILDAGGAVVASATNSAATDRTGVVATTAADAPAGDYVARVAWKAGGTARYAVSFSTPVRVTTVLPDWTAGEPFKQDLVALGGVPPLTFATQQSVPGLAVSNAGTRISGTPTAAGDHVVRVTVTDASGLGAPVVADLPLRVNPALAVVPLAGVAGGEPADLALGTGGTDASWTPLVPPPAGFTLSGGAALRLGGAGAAPRTFDVSASATDSVGAALAETSARVVVCAPLGDAAAGPVDATVPFGFWFDALAGSALRMEVRFRGSGTTPRLASLLDAAGTPVALGDALAESGRATRVSGFVLPRTSRYFAIFAAEAGFEGRVATARTRVRPPRRASGVVDVDTPSAVREVAFEALAGSRVHVSLRSAPVPRPAKPGLVEIVAPLAGALDLPAARFSDGGRRLDVRGARLPDTGAYVLRLGGDASTSGPLLYVVRIDPPRGGAPGAR